ncbi:hypothetical protein [Xenorhabdus siamensis]|uniref:hypothetical protein n=1 Tax=Xenorhabdus siamensis TaxID=3136254 RepID=UPI0030F42AFE
MKILFSIVLMALSLITNPAMASHKADIDFINESSSTSNSIYIVKKNNWCMSDPGPDKIIISRPVLSNISKVSIPIETQACTLFQWREIDWKVNYGVSASPESPGACDLKWILWPKWVWNNVGWRWQIESNCPIKSAKCSKDNGRGRLDMFDCLNKEVSFSDANGDKGRVEIVFNFEG